MFRAVLKTLARHAIRDKKIFSLSCVTEWCATIGSARCARFTTMFKCLRPNRALVLALALAVRLRIRLRE